MVEMRDRLMLQFPALRESVTSRFEAATGRASTFVTEKVDATKNAVEEKREKAAQKYSEVRSQCTQENAVAYATSMLRSVVAFVVAVLAFVWNNVSFVRNTAKSAARVAQEHNVQQRLSTVASTYKLAERAESLDERFAQGKVSTAFSAVATLIGDAASAARPHFE